MNAIRKARIEKTLNEKADKAIAELNAITQEYRNDSYEYSYAPRMFEDKNNFVPAERKLIAVKARCHYFKATVCAYNGKKGTVIVTAGMEYVYPNNAWHIFATFNAAKSFGSMSDTVLAELAEHCQTEQDKEIYKYILACHKYHLCAASYKKATRGEKPDSFIEHGKNQFIDYLVLAYGTDTVNTILDEDRVKELAGDTLTLQDNLKIAGAVSYKKWNALREVLDANKALAARQLEYAKKYAAGIEHVIELTKTMPEKHIFAL